MTSLSRLVMAAAALWVMSSSAVPAELVRDVVFLSNEEYLTVVREAIRDAKHDIEIEMYLIRPGVSEGNPVNEILDALGAARRRGVGVKVVLDRHFEADNGKASKLLKAAGVWDVRFDDTGVINHSKLVIVDGEVLILGSQNWTLSALAASNESAVYVRSRAVVDELRAAMKRARKKID